MVCSFFCVVMIDTGRCSLFFFVTVFIVRCSFHFEFLHIKKRGERDEKEKGVCSMIVAC